MTDDTLIQQLEQTKKASKLGGEYWHARDLQPLLGYARWENFKSVVEKAAESCRQTKQDVSDHFRGITKMIEVGKGARTEVEDVILTRYACYLIAMNGESSKAEIAAAQRYFAVKTRESELDQKRLEQEERVRLRGRLTEATKHLNSTAKKAGVQNYAFFTNAGYIGLYKMGLAQIRKVKGLGEKEDLFDRSGRLELAANEFRATLAEKAIVEKKVKGQTALENEHLRVGRAVRDTMQRESGVTPESLPAEPSIKKLESAEKKKLK